MYQPDAYRPNIRPLFAGYVFAWIDLTNWWVLKSTYGVLSVIFSCGFPARIPEAVVRELQKRERNGLVQPLPGYVIGQRLKINAGPLVGQVGVLKRMVRSDHLELLLPLLGAERPVTLKTGWVRPA
jgi:transcription antitermination factor NusG